MQASLPIDVIVPAYNAAALLPDALASVAAQTCGVCRVIVVDDGSTDDTAAVARSRGAIVISTPNRGIAEARNTGIRASNAAFVALLDADDRWYAERLSAQWEALEALPGVSLIATDYVRWNGKDELADGTLARHPIFPHLVPVRSTPAADVIGRADLLRAIVKRNFVLPSSMLLDRRLFDEHDLYFTPRHVLTESDDVFVGEDFEWLLRVLRHTDVAFVRRVLVDYRTSAGSLSARRGRIRNGDVVLGGLVAARPEVYAEGSPALFVAEKPTMLRESAIAHLRAGEIAIGARRLRDYAATQTAMRRTIVRAAADLIAFPPLQPAMRKLATLPRPAWLRAR